jgi:hypothetical protein
MIYTAHPIILWDHIKDDDTGGACGTCRGEEKCIQSFGVET